MSVSRRSAHVPDTVRLRQSFSLQFSLLFWIPAGQLILWHWRCQKWIPESKNSYYHTRFIVYWHNCSIISNFLHLIYKTEHAWKSAKITPKAFADMSAFDFRSNLSSYFRRNPNVPNFYAEILSRLLTENMNMTIIFLPVLTYLTRYHLTVFQGNLGWVDRLISFLHVNCHRYFVAI